MQDHRKLEIWKMACLLAIDVRAATDRFPKRGYAELKAQLISAVESIAHAIVEGCGADTQKEFARFLIVSTKSNREVEGQLAMAYGYQIISQRRWRDLTRFTVLIRKKTYALRKKVLKSPDPDGRETSKHTRQRRRSPHPTTRQRRSNPAPTTPNRKPQTGKPHDPQPKTHEP
jgi:four helix bundle protein